MRQHSLEPAYSRLPRIERKETIVADWNPPAHPVRLEGALKQILVSTRDIWDVPGIRASVRANFRKVIDCRTPSLGAEVYASDTEELLVMHTCKSRACPSCGHRATELWQRDRWCDLFDIPYSMVTLTMPDVLWTIFRENRELLHDLPALGAGVISRWALSRHGVLLDITVIQHTFGRHANFNCHLHALVSDLGFRKADGSFLRMDFDERELVAWWRDAVVFYIAEATKLGLVTSAMSSETLVAELTRQGQRTWRGNIARFRSKQQLLRYAGRYVRRPPIAQHRFVKISDGYVEFWTKDRKLKRRVLTRYAIEDFVLTLADHIPDHYAHSVRSFGLLAPRSIAQMRNALFSSLGQHRREHPPKLKHRASIKKCFGRDPYLDSKGAEMRKAGRLPAQASRVSDEVRGGQKCEIGGS